MSILVTDWSAYQADYHGDPYNFDQLYSPSYWTVSIDFAEALAGMAGIILRVGIGTRKDPCFDRYLTGVNLTGKPWAIYHAYDPSAGSVAQADLVHGWCAEVPPLGVWGDVEMGDANYPATNAYLHALDMHYSRTTGVYSGGPYLNGHFTAAEQSYWQARRLWIAGYPHFIPPYGWGAGAAYTLHQYTDRYQLPGMTHLCDMNMLNPALTLADLIGDKPMSVPIITHGPKIGIHTISHATAIPLVREAAAHGWRWPMVKNVNSPGVSVDTKAIDPATLTLTRFINDGQRGDSGEGYDALQGIEHWTDGEIADFAKYTIDTVFRRTNWAEYDATDWFGPINEPDNRGHYDAMARACIALIREADSRGPALVAAGHHPLRLALPALAQGTPEWADMIRLVDSGLFQLMNAGGHILDLHEGTFTGQPSDYGYGDLIPGAPLVPPGAGSTNFRHRYLAYLLASRGIPMPQTVISEFYGGGYYSDSPASHLTRFAWYDVRARETPYVIAYLPFTIDPDAGWVGSDYTPAYGPELFAYIDAEKLKINGETPMPFTQSIKDDLLAGVSAVAAKINAIPVDAAPWWQTATVPFKTAVPGKVLVFRHADGSAIVPNPRPNAITYQLDVFGVNVPLALLRVTDFQKAAMPDWYVLAAELSPA